MSKYTALAVHERSATERMSMVKMRGGFEKKNQMSELMSKSMSELMSESMSELEKSRMQLVLAYLKEMDNITSSIAASILDVQIKTANGYISTVKDFLKKIKRTC